MRTPPNIELKVTLMKKGLTQRDLAFATMIDENRISRIVLGYETPSEEVQKAISDYLGMQVEELFS